MNRKIKFATFSVLILVLVLYCIPISFAQNEWDYCIISAYGTNLVEGETSPQSFKFTVVAPPTGMEIPNTISLERGTEENYTYDLLPDDEVDLNYIDAEIDTYSFVQSSETDHFIILYEGEARTLRVNRQVIPEFSSILVAPLFLAVTLLAIIYRRKR
jgi:hypothetical protein